MPANTSKLPADIRVWDRCVRVFHWLLVAGVASAWFSAEYHIKLLHIVTGYSLALLLGTRLVWGFTGSHYARFAQFLYSPAQTVGYIKSLRSIHPEHYLGHNPLGALMVFALLATLLGMAITGLIVLAGIEFEGPLLPIALRFDDDFFYTVKRLHEWLANAVLVLIAAHIGGVVIASRQHHENLVRAMITGRKKNLTARDAQQFPASPSRESIQ
jgi:cytochrome b